MYSYNINFKQGEIEMKTLTLGRLKQILKDLESHPEVHDEYFVIVGGNNIETPKSIIIFDPDKLDDIASSEMNSEHLSIGAINISCEDDEEINIQFDFE